MVSASFCGEKNISGKLVYIEKYPLDEKKALPLNPLSRSKMSNQSVWQISQDPKFRDAFESVFNDFNRLLTCFLAFVTTVGTFFLYGIAWYEIYGNHRHRTLVNLLTGILGIYGSIMNNIMILSALYRATFGPMNYIIAAILMTVFKGLSVSSMTCANIIVTIRFLYISYFKSAGALNEEFFVLFFGILTSVFGAFFMGLYVIWGGWDLSRSFLQYIGINVFSLRIKIEPMPFPGTSSIGIGTLLLHLLLFSVFYVNDKNFWTKQRVDRQSKGFKDFMFRLFTCLIVSLSFLFPAIKTSMEPEDFEGCEYLYPIYTFLPMITLGIIWPTVYYWRSPQLRIALWKEVLESLPESTQKLWFHLKKGDLGILSNLSPSIMAMKSFS